MADKILLRILVAARPGIQKGILKMQDVVSEYFKQTGGKTIDPGDRAIIENEFIEFAPSNVTTPDAFKGFLNEGEIVNQSSTASRGPNVQKASEMSDTPFTDKVMKDRDVTLRGDETFGELTEKFGKSTDKGLGSMIPKEYYGYNRKGSEFSKIPSPLQMDDIIASERPLDTSRIKNWSQRDDYAKFIRKMRDKDFENKDIRNLVKDSGGDIAEGKRAATSVARAAEMVADTKVKQEMLSDLDEMKLERGPRWWKGDDRYTDIEGPMGADTRADMTKRLNNKVYHGVMEDLDGMLGEDKSYEVLKNLGGFGNRSAYKYDPDAFVQAIKEELEFNDVKYDMTFWENYVDEIMQLTTPEVPVFADGGLV